MKIPFWLIRSNRSFPHSALLALIPWRFFATNKIGDGALKTPPKSSPKISEKATSQQIDRVINATRAQKKKR
jgi:hypothetical protein